MAESKNKGKTGKTGKSSDQDRLIDAALALAAEMPWQQISLSQIARQADLPIGVALLSLPSRVHILRALIDRVDSVVFGSLADDPLDGTTKDKLFDVLMRRFDALADHRIALTSIARALRRDPLSAACLGGRVLKSMALSLQAADVSAEGCTGALKAKALGVIQLNAFRVWLNDEDPGLAATMKALDRGLSQAEKFATRRQPVSADIPKTA
ncbi:MAG: TetR/AcrR family transcriptional regulator [Rhodospirillales bacterium]|nr:TetR/AcrR family transcriptional regulator [Rhodospirillales bacterium]